MDFLKKLNEDRAELQAEMENMLATAEGEQRALNNEEDAKFKELESKINAIDNTIKAKEQYRASQNVVVETRKEDEMTQEERDYKVFGDFLMGIGNEMRADANFTKTDADAAGIVPKTISDQIIKEVKDRVPYLQFANVIYKTGTLSFPKVTLNSTGASYGTEGSANDAIKDEWTTIDLKDYIIDVCVDMGEQMFVNVDTSIINAVIDNVAEHMANKLDREFTLGTDEKVTGITSATNTVTTASATAITYDELVDLKHKIPQAYRGKGVWLMNDSTYTAICKLKDNDGRPYFEEDEYKILGCPVYVSGNFAEIGAGNKTIVFGDLSGYTIKFSKDMSIELLTDATYKRNHLVGVFASTFVDAKITNEQKIAMLVQNA